MCRRPLLHAKRACSAPRKPRCSRARLMQPRAWAAPVSGIRGARCAPFAACAWRQSPHPLGCCCALPIKKRASPASSARVFLRSLHGTLPVFALSLHLLYALPLLCLCFCSLRGPCLSWASVSSLLFSTPLASLLALVSSLPQSVSRSLRPTSTHAINCI